MNDNLSESLKEIYRSLPLRIRETIVAPETTDAYDRAEKQYGLTKEQREILSVQCGLLMMGLILPQELVPVLAKELQLPQQKVSLIAQDINREVFNLIKDELKEIHAIVGNTGAPKTYASETLAALAARKAPDAPPAGGAAPHLPPLAAPSQSIFEQKMGGTFRMKSDRASSIGSVMPTPGAPSATPPALPKVDPYREEAV